MIQCSKDVAHLHMPLRKLGVGTYVTASPNSPTQSPVDSPDQEKLHENPFYPIATATLDTRVFDIVHMFSERGISAVPIIDDNGVVVNMYETVDVIVRGTYFSSPFCSLNRYCSSDTCSARCISIS